MGRLNVKLKKSRDFERGSPSTRATSKNILPELNFGLSYKILTKLNFVVEMW